MGLIVELTSFFDFLSSFYNMLPVAVQLVIVSFFGVTLLFCVLRLFHN